MRRGIKGFFGTKKIKIFYINENQLNLFKNQPKPSSNPLTLPTYLILLFNLKKTICKSNVLVKKRILNIYTHKS